MKVDLERSTLVIVGAWNQAIFTEPWVQANIFAGPETVNMEVSASAQGLIPRFSGGAFRLIVGPDRLVWTPTHFRDDTIGEMEEGAKRLLGKLAVTPIHAVGINFGFEVRDAAGPLRLALETGDARTLTDSGIQVESMLVKRTFKLGGRTLNFAITRVGDGPTQLDLNFHQQVDGAKVAGAHLDGALLKSKGDALDLLERLYELKLE
jgi:hypothetical protein